MHFYLNFYSFQGGLKAAEPSHDDICHVRRALGRLRAASGAVGRSRAARDQSGCIDRAGGARPSAAGGAPAAR